MSNWKTYRLGDILNFRRGHDLPKTEMKGGDIPVAGSNGVIGYHNIATPITPCLTIGRSGNLGTPYIYDKCWAHNTVLYIDDFKGNDPKYLYYLLKTLPLASYGGGSAVPTLNRNHIHPIEIKHTSSLEIQQKIASILSSLDDKIEVNRRINEQLEELAQALFKSWLQNAREERSIGDMCDNILDYSPCPYNEVVLINSSDVTKGLFEHHEYSANSDLKGHFKKRFKKKDILYSEIRPRNQHYAYCLFDADKYIASTRLMILRNKQGIVSSSILYSYLLLDSVLEEFTLKTETRSGTFPQGKFEDMAQIKLPYYPIEEQSEMTDLLDFVYDKIWINQQEITHLTALRDTLLPKLMSGEIDVNEVM